MNKLFSMFAISIVLACSQTIYAGLKITPIQLYISDVKKQRSATVTLDYNESDQAKIFEVSAVKWGQNAEGEDVLEPDNSVVINPKNFVLQPNSKQIVRVGFTQMQAPKKEETWRIIFNEIAPTVKESKVNFLFNISVPLFVGVQEKVKLNFNPVYNGSQLSLNVKNNTNTHVQIKKITILDDKKKEVAVTTDMKYLLNNQQQKFNFGEIKLGDFNKYKLIIETDRSELPMEFNLSG
ncbi:fimbria/pilus periplasmic chaperone [Acinetobacter haemolyticus]|uniref:fimbrial biogenesis chaperone n=1 Tax=unclassified Acinetobacter TaxID=196816 RepID=UPI0015D14E48|nr:MULTISPECIES: fimbria/pilus periplasmic chaperone [unclassified Acinetobacter]MDD2945791.1 fimbria/pilus periplasmic chaperone [Acinetobacter sp.]UDM37869.1 fimbria/pilus periplasmic chaperone [Acinetobacter haemolyticus]